MSPRPIHMFAYGSNLSRAQMKRRCPNAVFAGKATLHGYRLVFAGHSTTWNGAVATLAKDPQSRVEGVLYRMTREEVELLDAHEGAPKVYQRAGVRVWDDRGRRRRAHVYWKKPTPIVRLERRYVGVIAAAYLRLGFDTAPLVRAIEEAA